MLDFQQQVLIATIFMIVIPMGTFFFTRHYLTENTYKIEEYYTSVKTKRNKIDMYSTIAAVIAIWFVILMVIIVKNADDWIDTFCRNRGDQIYAEEDVPESWLEDENDKKDKTNEKLNTENGNKNGHR